MYQDAYIAFQKHVWLF